MELGLLRVYPATWTRGILQSSLGDLMMGVVMVIEYSELGFLIRPNPSNSKLGEAECNRHLRPKSLLQANL